MNLEESKSLNCALSWKTISFDGMLPSPTVLSSTRGLSPPPTPPEGTQSTQRVPKDVAFPPSSFRTSKTPTQTDKGRSVLCHSKTPVLGTGKLETRIIYRHSFTHPITNSSWHPLTTLLPRPSLLPGTGPVTPFGYYSLYVRNVSSPGT